MTRAKEMRDLPLAIDADASGRLTVGSIGTDTTLSGGQPAFQVTGSGFNGYMAAVRRDSGPYSSGLILAKSRNGSAGSYSLLQDNDGLGSIIFIGDDGTNLDTYGATIQAEVNGTPAANNMPTDLVFSTNPGTSTVTERMRILKGGNVGIGTTSPLAILDIKGNTTTYDGMAKIYLTDSNGNSNSRNWSLGNGGSAFGNLTFAVSSAKDGVAGDGSSINVMCLDNSGNVLIGKTSNLSGARTLISGTKSGTNGTNGQLVVLDEQGYGTTDNGGGISFAGNFYNGGQVVFATVQGVKANNTDANNAGALKFTTKANGANQVEAMRIDSSGKVLVGKTASNSDANGVELLPSGQVYITANNTLPFYINRRGGGTELARFSDDGVTVGGISGATNTGELVISTSSGIQYISQKLTGDSDGIQYSNNGTYHLGPWISKNDTIDLGRSNSGWRNLYLTGGIQFDARSNKLDDYERGTYTPTYGNGSGSVSYSTRYGNYVKIGQFCRVWFDFTITGASGQSGTPRITLPFNSKSGDHDMGQFTAWEIHNNFTSGRSATQWITTNTSYMMMYTWAGDSNTGHAVWAQNTTGRIAGSVCYTTA